MGSLLAVGVVLTALASSGLVRLILSVKCTLDALMNYLAHLYLASDHPEAVLGSLMGDFVKGEVDQGLPAMLRHSIIEHRRIDSFTDAHPIVQQSKRRLMPEYRRYGGILIDMFYDHFLATAWDDHARVSLDIFRKRVYQVFADSHADLPARMQRTATYLVEYDLLGSYRRIEGIDSALKGVATRLSRPSPLGLARIELERLYAELQEDFSQFFPELIRFVDSESIDVNVAFEAGYWHRVRNSLNLKAQQ